MFIQRDKYVPGLVVGAHLPATVQRLLQPGTVTERKTVGARSPVGQQQNEHTLSPEKHMAFTISQ